MFRYICSYHQMSPLLIDMLESFGVQYRPSGFHSASFSQDDLAKPCKPSYMQINEIGRSDWQLRHCYKLNGLELSDWDEKWTMRRTAVYHSFDMDNGRAFWLTIKANNEIRDRIRDGSQSLETMKAHNLNTPGTSFESCLATHLVTLDWCAEGWRWHINAVESKIREVFHKVKSFPIDPASGEPDPTQQLAQSLTELPANDRRFSMTSRPSTWHTNTGPIHAISALKSRLTSKLSGRDKQPGPDQVALGNIPPQQLVPAQGRYQNIAKRLKIMQAFSFKELQQLNDAASKLKEAKLAMALNSGVLRDLRVYYQEIYDASTFPSEIQDVCSKTGSFDQFLQRVKSLEKHLEDECMRAEALVALIEDAVNLVSILQRHPPGLPVPQ